VGRGKEKKSSTKIGQRGMNWLFYSTTTIVESFVEGGGGLYTYGKRRDDRETPH